MHTWVHGNLVIICVDVCGERREGEEEKEKDSYNKMCKENEKRLYIKCFSFSF